jgi:6-phosphogluconolactonase (cycloisomerase 2 family)
MVKADIFTAALPPFGVQVNTAISWMADTMTASLGYKNAAASSATAADASATTAAGQVTLAAAQVALATTQAGNAATSAAQSLAYAQAAQASTVPTPVPNRFLGTGPTGEVAWKEVVIPASFYTGDILDSSRILAAPDWLACDGTVYLQGSYPALFAKIGLSYKSFEPPINAGVFTPAPAGATHNGVTFSQDGVYLASANSALTIYKRSVDTFTVVSTPPDGNSTCQNVAFSPDGLHLCGIFQGADYVRIYKRTGDAFARLANPDVMPSAAPQGLAYSPNGDYLAVAHSNGPLITIYKRTSDTYTKLANPAALPPGSTAFSVCFSPDSLYLVVTGQSAPYITIYKRSGDVFSKIADPDISPTANTTGSSFSPDGVHLAVATAATPFLIIYKRTGDVFTKLANPALLPDAGARSVAFSQDGLWLVIVGSSTAGYIYKRSGDTYSRLSSPNVITSAVQWLAISYDSRRIAVAMSTSPYLIVYKDAPYDTKTEFAVPSLTQPGTFASIKRYIKS